VARKTDKLAKYQSMRDFGVTSEPARNEKVKPSRQLRFVIQKHAATRLHYDLRLEYEGVFLSWAVTKGPSLDPKDRRLAVEVEPHPLDYGDFEGTIPKGEYGGGTVMLWDRGYWAPEPGTSIEQGLKKGDLKVVFAGERMKGGWALVRMKWDRERGKRNNWLLIKHHDGYEKEGDEDAFLEKNDTSIASGRTMEQIAAGKGRRPSPFMTAIRRAADAVWQSNRGSSPEDSAEQVAVENDAPKAGAADRPRPLAHGKTATLPAFVPPQLAKLVDRPPVGDKWGHEIKFDGYRLQLRVEGGKGRLLTRKGLDWTARFKEIAADGSSLPDGIYDGEAVALDDHGRPDFAALQDALSTGRTSGLVFYLFDALFNDGEDLRGLPLADRKARLQAAMAEAPASPRLRYVDHFQTSGEAVLNSACHMHLEGIISKRLDAPYQSGRGDAWVKAKCRGGQEVVIAGYTTTGTAFRSLIAGVYRDGRLIHVGRIGTGFGRDKLEKLLPRLKQLETDKSPFSGPGAPRKAANVQWLKPELVAEIEFAGWTGDGHIRQASFKGLREDKSAQDVVAEGRQAQEKVARDAKAQGAAEAAPAPPPAGRKGGPSVICGVSISNPDKPLWPDDGEGKPVTKLQMVQYLHAIAHWMLPHIKGRPCSIIRTPDGIEGDQRFFQRHAGRGTSSLITQVSVSGDREPYIQIDTPEALIAAAQSGATEYHPWNCAPDKPDMPGRLVFDLDPSEQLGFGAVIEGALEIRERLQALGLVTFCKTTGGKGLHVVTPLKPSKIDWPTAKAFARAVCEDMAADRPDRYLVNMAKAKRTGKIFLDYLRNDRMSTAVAPLSPRARPGAPVSFPLNWTQVRKGLDPKRFNIRTAPALLARTRDWDAYCDSERSLEVAIKSLAKSRKRAA
jgi:bifunctional non-homologous end joining protein LigD